MLSGGGRGLQIRREVGNGLGWVRFPHTSANAESGAAATDKINIGAIARDRPDVFCKIRFACRRLLLLDSGSGAPRSYVSIP